MAKEEIKSDVTVNKIKTQPENNRIVERTDSPTPIRKWSIDDKRPAEKLQRQQSPLETINADLKTKPSTISTKNNLAICNSTLESDRPQRGIHVFGVAGDETENEETVEINFLDSQI